MRNVGLGPNPPMSSYFPSLCSCILNKLMMMNMLKLYIIINGDYKKKNSKEVFDANDNFESSVDQLVSTDAQEKVGYLVASSRSAE